eukprot:TRINITY_DN9238_c0_g1_i1.p1 TRINITY_DN9238_c0_g1~~TRINITY_DN9238_c0_g1_i1.p1  ORF type:complete len:498 (+),score=128.47 TRINITY_DN9238_c0_g1_i1:22-1515(+)
MSINLKSVLEQLTNEDNWKVQVDGCRAIADFCTKRMESDDDFVDKFLIRFKKTKCFRHLLNLVSSMRTKVMKEATVTMNVFVLFLNHRRPLMLQKILRNYFGPLRDKRNAYVEPVNASCEEIVRFSHFADIVEVLKEGYQDENPNVRMRMCQYIRISFESHEDTTTENELESIKELLLSGVTDSDKDVRAEAGNTIKYIKEKWEQWTEESLRPLVPEKRWSILVLDSRPTKLLGRKEGQMTRSISSAPKKTPQISISPNPKKKRQSINNTPSESSKIDPVREYNVMIKDLEEQQSIFDEEKEKALQDIQQKEEELLERERKLKELERKLSSTSGKENDQDDLEQIKQNLQNIEDELMKKEKDLEEERVRMLATIEKEREQIDAIPQVINNHTSPEVVQLSVGGKKFVTMYSTLKNAPKGTYLHDITESSILYEGCIFIDRDPKYFRHILNFLRSGKLVVFPSGDELKEMISEVTFYGLEDLLSQIDHYGVDSEFKII